MSQDFMNQDLINSNEFNILIPYVVTNKFSFPANSNSLQCQVFYNSGNGQKLKKIYVTAVNGLETLVNSFNRANCTIGNTGITANLMVTSLQTYLNGTPLQQSLINCSNGQDYHYLENQLKGTSILSENIYFYKWFWLDNFSDLINLDDSHDPPIENLDCGLSLKDNVLYQFNATNTAGNPSGENIYIFAITERILTINAQGVIMIQQSFSFSLKKKKDTKRKKDNNSI